MKTDFLTVACPKCGATVGAPCQSVGGRKVAALYPHVGRVRVSSEKERVLLARRRTLAMVGT